MTMGGRRFSTGFDFNAIIGLASADLQLCANACTDATDCVAFFLYQPEAGSPDRFCALLNNAGTVEGVPTTTVSQSCVVCYTIFG